MIKYTSKVSWLDEFLVQRGIDPADVSDIEIGHADLVVSWWDGARDPVILPLVVDDVANG